MQEIHLQFPNPGQWDEFVMTARFPDSNGFVCSYRYTQDGIPADQAPALAAAVAAIASMGEDWQASQVWARLVQVTTHGDDVDRPPTATDAVALSVEAVNTQGGRRTFHAGGLPGIRHHGPRRRGIFQILHKAKP